MRSVLAQKFMRCSRSIAARQAAPLEAVGGVRGQPRPAQADRRADHRVDKPDGPGVRVGVDDVLDPQQLELVDGEPAGDLELVDAGPGVHERGLAAQREDAIGE
jgi:hypothetical protein